MLTTHNLSQYIVTLMLANCTCLLCVLFALSDSQDALANYYRDQLVRNSFSLHNGASM